MTSCVNGVPRGGCHFSPCGSNAKNKNKSPMLIPTLFHEVIINKCTNPSTARVFSIETNESEQRWQEVESDAHARCGALNFNGDVQSYDARSSKHVVSILLLTTH